MHILFVQPQPCIRALKYAEGLCKMHPDIRLSFAFLGNTLTELYGHGDECFEAWAILSVYSSYLNPPTILEERILKLENEMELLRKS